MALQMIVVIWSFKGGVGKSTVAALIAKQTGWPVVTNDIYTALEGVVSDLTILRPSDSLPVFNHNIIIDLGGYVERRVVDGIRQADLVIIPTLAETASVKSALAAVREIQPFGKPILIVANRAKEQDLSDIQEVFGESVKVVRLKESRFFQRVLESGPTDKLEDLAGSILLRHAYREPLQQAKELNTIIQSYAN
jgi:MinD-like ATPase involved in chromosome partitioning or flagellar assembly